MKYNKFMEQLKGALTPELIKQGIGIARDKRYAGGNMSGAVEAMNKLHPKLSSHPKVADELRKQNEETLYTSEEILESYGKGYVSPEAKIKKAMAAKGVNIDSDKHRQENERLKAKYQAILDKEKNQKEEAEYSDAELDEMIYEVLAKDATASDYIHDFVHSDNPRFKGKSKEKRKQMALAAYYQREATEDENKKAIADFLAKGGKIKKLPPGKAQGWHGKADPQTGHVGMLSKKDTERASGPRMNEAVKTGNEGRGYHGQAYGASKEENKMAAADKAFATAHATVKKHAAGHLSDVKDPNKMVKHYLDSQHGRHLHGNENADYIKKDFGSFKKRYKPEMHEEVEIEEALSPKQKKIASLAGDKGKIDSADFAKLRSMKEETGKHSSEDAVARDLKTGGGDAIYKSNATGSSHKITNYKPNEYRSGMMAANNLSDLLHTIDKKVNNKTPASGNMKFMKMESAEQIDEMERKTIEKYHDASWLQRRKLKRDHSSIYGTDPKVQKQIDKRERGLALAQKKMYKEEMQNVFKTAHTWGNTTKVYHNNDHSSHSYVLHPEHVDAVKKLNDGESTKFTDETGNKVTAERKGETIHFTGSKLRTGSAVTTAHRKYFMEAKDEGEYGYEGDMAVSQLKSLVRNSNQLIEMLKPNTDLPEWVQSKITLADDYITTAANYMASEMTEEAEVGPVKVKVNHALEAPHEEEWEDTGICPEHGVKDCPHCKKTSKEQNKKSFKGFMEAMKFVSGKNTQNKNNQGE